MRRRRDEYDDDEDDDRAGKPPRGGLPPGVWVLLGVAVAGAGALALGVVAVIASQAERQQRQTEQQQQQTEPVGKLYTRDEFRKLLMGKTMDEVIQLIGKPDSTSDFGDGEPTWRYKEITTDPVSSRTDTSVTVWFNRGKRVFNVTY